MKAYDSGVAGRNVKAKLGKFTSRTFHPVTRMLLGSAFPTRAVRPERRSRLMLHFSALRCVSRPRGRARGFGNQVTFDLTLHCYNLARFFRPDLRLAS
jgi:hypothetical protein